MNRKPLCIIPAKGNSRRFPRKNTALLNGKPLVSHAIEAAISAKIFSRICVSSEDKQILEIARSYDPRIAITRPEKFAQDNVQVDKVCIELIKQLHSQGQYYNDFAVLLPTAPLRTKQDIKNAYRLLTDSKAFCVLSVTAYSHPPQRAVQIDNGYVKSYFGLNFMKQAQNLEQLYRHDGTIIFIETDKFLKAKTFWIDKIIPYFVDKTRSIDIDTLEDLLYAEFLQNKITDLKLKK